MIWLMIEIIIGLLYLALFWISQYPSYLFIAGAGFAFALVIFVDIVKRKSTDGGVK